MFPKMMSMKQPMTRGEFEERINLTHEQIHTGKLHPNGLESLLEVRQLPNGRIDMLSVNEMVRLNANMIHRMVVTDFGKMLRQKAENGKASEEEGVEDTS